MHALRLSSVALALALAALGRPAAAEEEDFATTNRQALGRFLAAAQGRRPVTVVSFGDSMADSYRSVTWALMRSLVAARGIAGYSLNNYANATLIQLTNGAAMTSSSALWFCSHVRLPPGAGLWWENQRSRGGVDSDRVGVFWVAQPAGGRFTLSVSTTGGAWAVARELDGYSPAPVGHFTPVELPRSRHRVRVDGVAGTNYILGPQLLLTGTGGVHAVFMDQGGISLGEVIRVPAAVREPVMAALQPDLLVWHMKEDGAAATSNRMVECERWWSGAAPGCDVVYIGTPWVRIDTNTTTTLNQNRLVRRIAASYGRTYVDLMRPAVSYESLRARGFMSDETHLNAEGGKWLAARLWDDLGFDVLRPAPSGP
jgi:hypothetical protein